MDHRYPAQSPLTGICFRVIAHRHGTWLCDPMLTARNPHLRPTETNAVSHLIQQPFAGPWKSMFCTWDAAMTRRASFLQRGATTISILAIDIESYGFGNEGALRNVVDAHSLAVANALPNLQWYGYVTGMRAGFPKEYLVPNGIPDEAIVAWLPANGLSRDIPVHLGILRLPEALVEEAGAADEEVIKTWVLEETFMRTGIWDMLMAQRLLRAMCSRAWDYDLDV